jgi:prepilin peptidase CpaA
MTTASLAATAGLSVFVGAMIYAGIADLVTMRIRNHVPALLVIAYAGSALAAGLPPPGIAASVLAALAVLVVGFFCFCRGWIGGGDAKLASAATLWLGSDQTLPFLAVAALAGGILTLFLVSFRLVPLQVHLGSIRWLRQLHDQQAGVPYGLALATGSLLLVPQTRWMELIQYQ